MATSTEVSERILRQLRTGRLDADAPELAKAETTTMDRVRRIGKLVFGRFMAPRIMVKAASRPSLRRRSVLRVGPGGRIMLKAHVKQYSRINQKTGEQVNVAEHDDRRPSARMRYATIHTGDHSTPGHAVRIQPHPTQPGRWSIHPKDRPTAKRAMAGKPADAGAKPVSTTLSPAARQAAQAGAQGRPQAEAGAKQSAFAGAGPHFRTEREKRSPPPPGEFFSPDPAKGEASRVGVPGMNVPPPPPIPRLPNLTKDERAAESEFADAYMADPDGMARKLRDLMESGKVGDGPNIYATDEAKCLSGHWNPEGVTPEKKLAARALYNTAVHQTANALTKRAFTQHLAELAKLPEGDPKRHVLVTAGGVAAGKGYALSNVPAAKQISDTAGAVWDAAGEQNSTECAWVRDTCKKYGIESTFVYVHADPLQTWENPERGVVERAQKKGRMVDARAFADSYVYGPRNFAKFHESVKGDASVNVVMLDNTSKSPAKLDAMPSSALTIDAEELYSRCLAHLQKAKVSHAIKRGGAAGVRIWGRIKQAAGEVAGEVAGAGQVVRQPAFG